MKTRFTPLFRKSLQACFAWVVLLSLPASGHAWEPNAQDLDAAINRGDFTTHFDNLSAWLGQRLSAEASGISEAALKPLLQDPVFANALSQRQFIAKHGAANLGIYARADQGNKAFLAWLLQNTEAMDLYLEGATPLGIGQREQNQWTLSTASLEIWNKIRNADPEAKAGMYQRLAIATALAPPGSGNRGAGMAKTPGDPVDRYKHFKSASSKREMFPGFDRLAVWEYERVVSSCASDSDLGWAREMLNTWRPDLRINEQVVRSTSEVCYRKPLIPFTDYRSVLAAGGKCGPRSSWAVMICQAFGIPSVGVGQPAHACVAWRTADGTWKVGYGGGWEVSKLEGLSGMEFVEAVAARSRAAEFSQVEYLRWLGAALTSKEQVDAVMGIARKIHQSLPAAKAAAPEMQAEAEANGSVKAAPKTPTTGASANTPEAPFPVVSGVIHVEAETFINSYAEPAHPDEQKGRVFVYDCFTGGKQVNFQRNMTISWVDYVVDLPAAGVYELTVRTATPNFEQVLDIRSGETKLATINVPNTTGLWGTTSPVDIKLEKGKQTLRISAPFQRGIAIRWFELKAK